LLLSDPAGVNRNVVVVVPTEAFFEWARKFPEEDTILTMDDLTSDVGSYLIPMQETDAEGWLKRNYKKIFDIELGEWCPDHLLWPKNLSYQSFKIYFRCVYSSIIIDMGRDPLERIEI